MSNPGVGPSAARNHGAASVARGKIVAFCDADDIWSPEKLWQLHRFFISSKADGAYGQVAYFDQSPSTVRRTSTVLNGALTVPALLRDNPVCTLSNLAMRRDVFRASGGFDEGMVQHADLDFLVRVVDGGAEIQGIDTLQVWYRRSRTGLTANLIAERQGRVQALATAKRLGYLPCAHAEAQHLRRLASRALRIGAGPVKAMKLAAAGLAESPQGFLSQPAKAAHPAFA